MKQKNELLPMSAQERKEDIDMLMNSEMMDATIGSSGCTSGCPEGCQINCNRTCSSNVNYKSTLAQQ
ncbi:MAG: hypothetical protein LBP63_08540 [Prevotellaceae bacterium]|jgi:hypothetical protein|nr:hypothetical protein [Prevotellaceae bacterium]